jgi:cellulose synthase/poly-beta-1,6-N-acetylglucosamine synthase-like glycosyltransferase
MSTLVAVLDALAVLGGLGLLLAAGNYLYVLGCYFLSQPPWSPPVVRLADPPHVLLQIPLYNEPRVAEGAVLAAAALDWPRERLHIQILDDSTDETAGIAGAAVARLRAAGHDIAHVRRDNRAGFKAGALAAGLQRSDAPFVAMLDADFRAPADWLHATVGALLRDPAASFVQSRIDFANGGLNTLTRAQQLMMDGHFLIEQGARAARGVPLQANGTATVWRREAIDAGGGWSGDTLAEDLDLALRVYLAGGHGLFLANPAPRGEVPANARDWRTQQSRWASGFAQVARKLLAEILRSGMRAEAKISAGLMVMTQIFFPALVLTLVAVGAGSILRGGIDTYVPGLLMGVTVMLVVLLGMTLPPYLALRRGGPGRYALTVLSLPLMMARLAFANALDILTASFGRQRGFVVTPKQGI